MRRISPKRRRQRQEYTERHSLYLSAHPFCQIFIAVHGLDEATVIENGGAQNGYEVPAATEIHHRNKGRGARLNDERWWMAASRKWHEIVENSKTWARRDGYLLPAEADADGVSPSGLRALETPELMRKCALRGRADSITS